MCTAIAHRCYMQEESRKGPPTSHAMLLAFLAAVHHQRGVPLFTMLNPQTDSINWSISNCSLIIDQAKNRLELKAEWATLGILNAASPPKQAPNKASPGGHTHTGALVVVLVFGSYVDPLLY